MQPSPRYVTEQRWVSKAGRSRMRQAVEPTSTWWLPPVALSVENSGKGQTAEPDLHHREKQVQSRHTTHRFLWRKKPHLWYLKRVGVEPDPEVNWNEFPEWETQIRVEFPRSRRVDRLSLPQQHLPEPNEPNRELHVQSQPGHSPERAPCQSPEIAQGTFSGCAIDHRCG